MKNTEMILFFFINSTDPIPHLRPCTDTRIKTFGPKIGFIKEVEIYLCLYLWKPSFFITNR